MRTSLAEKSTEYGFLILGDLRRVLILMFRKPGLPNATPASAMKPFECYQLFAMEKNTNIASSHSNSYILSFHEENNLTF